MVLVGWPAGYWSFAARLVADQAYSAMALAAAEGLALAHRSS